MIYLALKDLCMGIGLVGRGLGRTPKEYSDNELMSIFMH